MSAFLEVHLTFADPDPGREIAVALLAEAGCTMFHEDGNELWAYAAAGEADLEAVEQVHDDLKHLGLLVWEVNEVQGENWNARWEADYPVVHLESGVSIRAPFHPPSAVGLDVVIQPDMSFGTGHHPTTRLMVEHVVLLPLSGKRVLDMGTGTGVLALLAHKVGASYVLAVDIESRAIENVEFNAALNGISPNRDNIELHVGDATSVLALELDVFDVILANINRNVLMSQWGTYDKLAAENATLVTSGFFQSDAPLLTEFAESWGWEPRGRAESDDWACIVWNRKSAKE